MLQAVGFDLWETLITNTPEALRRQERLRFDRMAAVLEAHGHHQVVVRMEQAYRDVWNRCHDLYWGRDLDISCRRQIEHLIEEMGLSANELAPEAIDELESVYARAALEIPPAALEGARDVLDLLRARGLRVGLISNTGRTPGYALREILERIGLASSLDHLVFSNEHGLCKPQRSIFEELQRGLGVPFEAMAFVGDNLHVDVAGAQAVGMRAVHFDPPTRGTAVAPAPASAGTVIADARIVSLRELPAVLERWTGGAE
jgi:putative hydrolase of the HAD superfamily